MPKTLPHPTIAEQAAAERVLRHGAHHMRDGRYLSSADLRALIALLNRLRDDLSTERYVRPGGAA